MALWTESVSGWGSSSTFHLDGTGDKYAVVFQAPSDQTISKILFGISAIAGTAPTYKGSIQGATSTAGEPDNTVKGGASPASATRQPTTGDPEIVTLDNTYTPSVGEWLSIVWEHDSGTINSSNRATVFADMTSMDWKRPEGMINAGGGWSKRNGMAIFGYETTDGDFYGHCMHNGITDVAIGTVGHRAGNRFSLPADAGTTYKVKGLMYNAVTSVNDHKLGIWDGTTEKGSVTVTPDVSDTRVSKVLFDSDIELDFGTEYRCAIERTGSVIGPRKIDYNLSQALSTIWNGELKASTFDGTSWADDDDRHYLCYPILSDITK